MQGVCVIYLCVVFDYGRRQRGVGGEETAGRGREESEKTSKHSSHLVVHTNNHGLWRKR